MSHARRARAGIRRDGGVQRIRSDRIRYPGANLPDIDIMRVPVGSTQSLRPVRDTGLAVEGRLARERRRRARESRTRLLAVLTIVGTLAVAGLGWRYSSDREARLRPVPSAVATADAGQNTPAFNAINVDPTPIIANVGNLEIRLPVPLEELTEVGFHQASNNYAIPMETKLPTAGTDESKRRKSTGRDLSKQEDGPDAWLTGHVLRMWRNRPGKPDTAVDVGAPAGASVYAPVSGTIVKIKTYSLYGKYNDYEIHIVPEGREDLDCVMIHVDDLSCEVGDTVVAGVTRIAAVRLLSNKISHQLGDYTKDGGDHVHVQVNDANDPQYKGLEGAIGTDGS